ncbi:MAG TPA: helix-turn-helix domain-containing protein [Pirellulales bacterium]|nr:helix-turn-helix domain-containing protein [Pirellulales bacterium]
MNVSDNQAAQRLLLKPDEAAAALAVSPRCLWGLTKAGEIPAVRIGRAVRYDVADLRAWIEARKAR